MLAMACCRSDRTLSMRVLEWASSSLTFLKVWLVGAGSGFITLLALGNQCSDGLTHRHTHYIAVHIQIEDNDGQFVVAAHGYGRGVHHAQVFRQDLGVADLFKADCIVILQ